MPDPRIAATPAPPYWAVIFTSVRTDLEPEAYLRDLIRVMPYWPRERYLELAPKYWAATRARLDDSELDMPLGHVTVPPPRSAHEQQPTG